MAFQHSFLRDVGPLGPLTNEHRISRRAILQKLVGLTLAGGSITSFITSCSSPTSLTPQPLNPTNLSIQSPTSTAPSLRTALYIYRGHSASVVTVAWSPDGKRIASGSNDSTVQVWDATNGGHVYTDHGHVGRVNAVVWSPDGKRIASGSADTTSQVWDAVNGGHVLVYRGQTDAVWSVAWSPDGKRIVSGSGNIDTGKGDTTAQVWDATNGGPILIYRGQSEPVWSVAWSPDNTLVASGSAVMTVQVWRA
jgi:WD40 repeat protein